MHAARTRHNSRLAVVLSMVTLLGIVSIGAAPVARAADGVLSYVGAASTAGNRTSHTVGIPGGCSRR